MAVTAATISVSPAKLFLSSPTFRAQQQPITRRPSPNFYRPFVSTRTSPTATATLRVSRLGISDVTAATTKRVFRVLAASELGDGDSETPESGLDNSNEGATIDLKLPRRRLLVQFTCNSCGERTKRLVNRLAYERGTVFVQCAGCLQHHKLVDNLGLVVEYDFREEINVDLKTDQV